jgi:hypothetical protein
MAVTAYLQEVVVRPRYQVQLRLAHPTVLASPPPLALKAVGRAALQSRGIEAFVIDLARWSERLSGAVVVVFARGADGRLSHQLNGTPVRFGSDSVEASTFIDGYAGNRLTVNGFRMTAKRISRVLGIGKVRIPIAFDIDVVGDGDIVYDVARDKIIGRGKFVVAKAFREAVQLGLEDLGVLRQLAKETRQVLDQSFQAYTKEDEDSESSVSWLRRPQRIAVLDQALLDATEALLPRGDWPKNLYKEVAEQLGVSKNLASRAISTLIELGRVRRQEQQKPRDSLPETLKPVDSDILK